MGGLINIKNNNNETVQRMKFSIKYFFSKCDQNLQFSADLFTFTEEILNGKLHFLLHCECFRWQLFQYLNPVNKNLTIIRNVDREFAEQHNFKKF